MTVLIAGVGYLGAPLAHWYLDRGIDVVGLENFYSTSAASLAALRSRAGFELIRGSITSPSTLQRVFARGPFDVVHLLAAQPSANEAAANPNYTERTNLTGARMLLDAALASKSRRVVFGSSFHVYGTPLTGTVGEDRTFGSFADLSHLSKVYVEKLVDMYARTRGLEGASVRLGIVYGLGPVMKREAAFQTVPNRFSALAAAGQPLTVNPAASHPIGFIHLGDATAALIAAAEHPEKNLIANAVGEVLTVPEVADVVSRAAHGRGMSITITSPLSGSKSARERFRVTSRLSKTGWRPKTLMSNSIGDVIDYFRDQPVSL